MEAVLALALLVALAVIAFLALRKKPAPVVLTTRRDFDKASFHVERFTRALEQSTDPVKRAELEKNLAYWTQINAAEGLRG